MIVCGAICTSTKTSHRFSESMSCLGSMLLQMNNESSSVFVLANWHKVASDEQCKQFCICPCELAQSWQHIARSVTELSVKRLWISQMVFWHSKFSLYQSVTCLQECQKNDVHISLKALTHFWTLSDDPVSCYRKPVERTSEIKGYAISLVRSTGFL